MVTHTDVPPCCSRCTTDGGAAGEGDDRRSFLREQVDLLLAVVVAEPRVSQRHAESGRLAVEAVGVAVDRVAVGWAAGGVQTFTPNGRWVSSRVVVMSVSTASGVL